MSLADRLGAVMDSAGGAVPGHEMARSGLTLARVTNIKDDKNFNRVKCLPIGGRPEEETDWCYVMTPMGGKECGLFFFPQVDDLVILAYLDDDPHRPLVLGSFWNTEVKPPYPVQDGTFFEYSIRTPKKTELLFCDEDKKQKVTLTMPSGTVLALDDEKQQVSLQDKDGKNALTMNLKGGEITLKAEKKLILDAGGTQIILEQSGNITLKGNGTVSIKGANIQEEASAGLTLKGAQATLEASGPTTVKGAVVKIN